jgi:hypothetical protein
MNNLMNNLIKIDDLITIFDNSHPYEQYETILNEPLNADFESTQNSENDYPHYQECYCITNDNIKKSKNIIIKNLINCIYFVYTDLGNKEFDDKYWFFIGNFNFDKEGKHNFYFSYEVGRSGTGFGLGETSRIHFSRTKELLLEYGLTNKQRNLIRSTMELN